jgi:Transposase DDE domain
MKATLARVATVLQQLFFQSAEAAAAAAKLIKRPRKLTPSAFAQGLTFAWLEHPNATTGQLARSVALAGASLSEPGLCQRFTPAAATFFLNLLKAALQVVLSAPAATMPLLARFNGVYLLDSTQLTLPAALASLYASTGGALSPAGLKVMTTLELLGGVLSFELGQGRQGELTFGSSRQGLPKGALHLADLGFFDMDLLRGYELNGVFWISRVPPQTLIKVADGRRLSLWRYLDASPEVRLEERIEVGEGLRCRLLAWRCPQEVASRRLQKALANAQKKGKALSAAQRAMCRWTVLLSNVPAELLSGDEAWVVYRVRWQVELLFKRWKSLGGLAQSRGEKPYRVLTEVYAKLLGVVVRNWLMLLAGASSMRRSAFKSFQEVQSWGRVLLLALGNGSMLLQVLALLAEALRRVAAVNSRKGRPATFQTLEHPQQNGPQTASSPDQAGGTTSGP